MKRDEAINAVLKSLRSACSMKGIAEKPPFQESTVVIGQESAVLDSLGTVMFLVQLEEALNAALGSETLLVQRLMAQDLQVETVGSLADRVLQVLGDSQ
ncbi:MAG TPA: hypothetical protein VGK48_13850 [Terriglobia bacterium]|jgi:acyl carrier protein